MDHSTDTTGWQQFMRAGFKLRFSYPTVTPQGHAVDVAEEERDDGDLVHLTARDSQEVYVEVTNIQSGLIPCL